MTGPADEFTDGIDPVACTGMAGYLDANWECKHGRLPYDRTPACGCWVENHPHVVRGRPRPVRTVREAKAS